MEFEICKEPKHVGSILHAYLHTICRVFEETSPIHSQNNKIFLNLKQVPMIGERFDDVEIIKKNVRSIFNSVPSENYVCNEGMRKLI